MQGLFLPEIESEQVMDRSGFEPEASTILVAGSSETRLRFLIAKVAIYR